MTNPVSPTPLAQRAMLVRLHVTRPNVNRKDAVAEDLIQRQLDDTSLVVMQRLFKSKDNPVRTVLNMSNEVYAYHRAHTLPWVDKGPRLLPVDAYETYTSEMRQLIARVSHEVHQLGQHVANPYGVSTQYDACVRADINQRGARASIDDYPTYDDFKEKMTFTFHMQPLPDKKHFLFDVADDDLKALDEMIANAEVQAQQEMRERVRAPLIHLLKKLSVPVGSEGSIFRDTAVQNVMDECDIVAQLAMGDAEVLKMVDEVRDMIRPHAKNPDVLRQSPVVRSEAAKKLADVASRMGFLMGGSEE